MSAPSFATYFLYFLIMTCALPTVYFYFRGVELINPAMVYLVVFCGFFSFILGYALQSLKKSAPSKPLKANGVNGLSTSSQFTLSTLLTLVLYAIFLPLRLQFNIGVPDAPPSIQFAGWIYYLSTLGVQASFLAMFLASKRKRINFLVLAIFLAFYAIYEAKLGWRFGLLESGIILSACYTFSNTKDRQTKTERFELRALIKGIQITAFFAALFFLVDLVLTFQVDIRNPGTSYALDQIVFRFWGAKFLDVTMSFFLNQGYSIFTNNYHFWELLDLRMTGAEFNNFVIYGNSFGHHNGNSKSGFGSLYIYGGLTYVIIIFFITGIYFSFIEQIAKQSKKITINVALFLHYPILFKIVNEQYEFGTLKTIAAIWLFAFLSGILVTTRNKLVFGVFGDTKQSMEL